MAKIRLRKLRTANGTAGLFSTKKIMEAINVGSYWVVCYFCTPNKVELSPLFGNGPVVQWIE